MIGDLDDCVAALQDTAVVVRETSNPTNTFPIPSKVSSSR